MGSRTNVTRKASARASPMRGEPIVSTQARISIGHIRVLSARPDIHTAALAPFDMQVFCDENMRQCAGSGTASQVTATNDLLAVLSQVNRRV